jgi:hypothetical protein
MARLARGCRRLAGVDGLRVNFRGGDGGVPGTTWVGLAVGEVGIFGDGDLGNSTSGSSTSAEGSNSSGKGGGGIGGRSTMIKGLNSASSGE